MKKTLLSIIMLCVASIAVAQPAGGFGGIQAPQVKLETSQEFKDVNYAGDEQAYHTCDIYLPKQEKASYPVVIHIYGSAHRSCTCSVVRPILPMAMVWTTSTALIMYLLSPPTSP